MLIHLLRENNLNCTIEDLGTIADSDEEVRSKLGEALKNFDLIITSGGVSMGEKDLIKPYFS